MHPDHPGQQLFSALKASTTAHSPTLVLPVATHATPALIRPISTIAGHLDSQDVALLTRWRNQHVKSFLTEFVATEEQTAHWLANAVHGNPGKMLFMVETLDGKRVGHVGLGFIDWENSYGEADAIVSGGESPPGLMKTSLLTLMQWARDALGLKTLAVRVRSDNTALEFYKKVGFREFKRVPITAEHVAQGIHWKENPSAHDAPAALVHMALAPNF